MVLATPSRASLAERPGAPWSRAATRILAVAIAATVIAVAIPRDAGIRDRTDIVDLIYSRYAQKLETAYTASAAAYRAAYRASLHWMFAARSAASAAHEQRSVSAAVGFARRASVAAAERVGLAYRVGATAYRASWQEAADATLERHSVAAALDLSRRVYDLGAETLRLAYTAELAAYQAQQAAAAATEQRSVAALTDFSRSAAEKLRLAYNAGLAYETARWQRAAKAPADATVDPALAPLIAEASRRYGVPARWIRAVMRVESDGRAAATSPKGAMGLMQVMPQTYADLRDRYGFGGNPYATRDNILAGSAYIREMYDRYGSPGFIAAYNAGPNRYDDFVTKRRDLPDETRRYVAAVGYALGENFAGTVIGNLPPPLHLHLSLGFYMPILVSPHGEMLAGRTGAPVSLNDRLALHQALSRAVGIGAR